jgi:hypothetical protein
MQPHKIRVYLALYEFTETPEALTTYLDLQPDRTFRTGDRVGFLRNRDVRKFNGWIIESGLPWEVDDLSDAFKEHVEAVLKRIEPSLERFAEVAQRSYCELAVVLELEAMVQGLPSIAFDKESLAVLAAISANIDFDMYVFGGRKQPNDGFNRRR